MKSLTAFALLAALALPAVAQVADTGKDPAKEDKNMGDTTELKKRFKNSRPAPAEAPAPGVPAGKGGQEAETGMSIAELQALLPDCKVNTEDTKDIAEKLKGKYGIANCIGGPIILVPKTKFMTNQTLEYPGIRRARFVDHYLVLQFDGAVQYQDVLKDEEVDEPNGKLKVGRYSIAGYVDTVEKSAAQFKDVIPFTDALKNYVSVGGTDQGALTAVPARVKAHAGDAAYRLTSAYVVAAGKKELRVSLATGGRTDMIWPRDEWPTDKK